MRINRLHPYGRFLKALRIVNRIQGHIDKLVTKSTETDPDEYELYDKYIVALKHPMHPSSAALLKEFLEVENSWPSNGTLEIAAELMEVYYIESRKSADGTT